MQAIPATVVRAPLPMPVKNDVIPNAEAEQSKSTTPTPAKISAQKAEGTITGSVMGVAPSSSPFGKNINTKKKRATDITLIAVAIETKTDGEK